MHVLQDINYSRNICRWICIYSIVIWKINNTPPKEISGAFLINAYAREPLIYKGLLGVDHSTTDEVGVTLNNNGYNGDLTSRQAGSIGGQMVKKMVESYENSLGANNTTK